MEQAPIQFLRRLKVKSNADGVLPQRRAPAALGTGTTVTTSELVKLRAYAPLSLPNQPLAGTLAQGSHLASSHGRGMEFDEVRHYQPGDDIRTIDWRVTARTGKPHTKLFREERQQPVLICLDQSQSMLFGSRVAFKSVAAARTASLLAWTAAGREDRIGGIIFSAMHHLELKPVLGRQGVLALIRQMNVTPSGTAAPREDYFSHALTRLTTFAQQNSRIYLLSDFYHWSDQHASLATRLAQRHRLTLIMFFDPMESAGLAPGNYPITNGDQFATLYASNSGTPEYIERFHSRKTALSQLARRLRSDFLAICTQDAEPATLRKRLAMRQTRE